jgi:hypothetical protein
MNSQKTTRRQQFCQIQSEITGSDQYLVVGIDVAKDKHHAFMGTASGKTLLKKLVFENDIDGFRKLLQRCEAARVQNGLAKIVLGLEPTGNYHKPLANHLTANGYHVVLATGKAVKDNRRLLDGRWDKNDTKDAANVADLVSRGRCLYYDAGSAQINQLRDLLSLRRRLKKKNTASRCASATPCWPNTFLSWTAFTAPANLSRWPLCAGVWILLNLPSWTLISSLRWSPAADAALPKSCDCKRFIS